MRVGERIAERRKARGMSQGELARRAGLSQGTIGKLEAGLSSGSSYLHRIARELETTSAYLMCETDDPDAGAPPPPPPAPTRIMMEIVLPPQEALAEMFVALLDGLDREAPTVAQALLLAQSLPIALSRLTDLRPAPNRAPVRVRERA